MKQKVISAGLTVKPNLFWSASASEPFQSIGSGIFSAFYPETRYFGDYFIPCGIMGRMVLSKTNNKAFIGGRHCP